MTEQQPVGLDQELKQAFDDLRAALQRASDATAAISQLAPRIHAVAQVFDQIEAAVAEGRRQLAGASSALEGTVAATVSYARPTLVVAEAEPVPQPSVSSVAEPAFEAAAPAVVAQTSPLEWASAPVSEWAPKPPPEAPSPDLRGAIDGQGELASFRLEFESHPGPLDLRAVDEAISEHPAVRDIALLDYDGHRATLKVWVEGSASPADVQSAIRDQVSALFSSDNEISVVALEDAA
ncbi:MAG TPA: hypothetical protein VFY79_11690 [Dehalococcoidia bacterium]|jgi:hypothetical protein|nr:hypothetical protein [Dehalococcoidia bacterium]